MRKFFSIFLLILLIPGAVMAQEEVRQRFDMLFGEHAIYEDFFYEFKETILSGDPDRLSRMNAYPLDVYSGGEHIVLNNEEEFIQQYSAIITPSLVLAVREQSFDGLFSNYQGVMIGHGQIWFSGICIGTIPGDECDDVEVKIVTYNIDAPTVE